MGNVPEPDEHEDRAQQHQPEERRHTLGTRELENEAAAYDAELQRVSRRIICVGSGSPLDAETDNEAPPEDARAVQVERALQPTSDYGGGGGDGDGEARPVPVDDVDTLFGELQGVKVITILEKGKRTLPSLFCTSAVTVPFIPALFGGYVRRYGWFSRSHDSLQTPALPKIVHLPVCVSWLWRMIYTTIYYLLYLSPTQTNK